MKFYKNNETTEPSNNSIIKKGDIYVHTNNGEEIGTIVVSQEDAIQIGICVSKELLAKVAAEFNVDPNDIYISNVIDNNLMYSSTLSKEYWMTVYKKQNKNELPYGVFELKNSMSLGTYLKPFKSKMNDVKLIPTHNLKNIVLDFFANISDNGRKNKLGVLIYGEPGNGKTSDLMQLFPLAEQEKMRILIVGKSADLTELNDFKAFIENDKTIFIMEELTERVQRGAEEMLTFLDGENSWNNSVIIATTNHPTELPANLVDRPGRFEKFIEYKNPTKVQILELAEKFDIPLDQAACLAGQELSFDYVSFILSQSKKLGTSVKETRDNEETKRRLLSQTFKGKMGI